MAGLRLLTDEPLGTEGARKDGLGFENYSQALAEAAINTPGPFTIGIFGGWGTGKTSLMRLTQSKLAMDENVVPVWFNAWQYELEDHPVIPLIATIVQTIESDRTLLEKIGKKGGDLVKALRAVLGGLSAKAELQVPGIAKVELQAVLRDMQMAQSPSASDRLVERSLYYGAFEALAKAPLPAKKRVVLLIDDLDRCFPHQAIRLLESIKLVLSQPGFIFILGVDQEVLRGYLKHRYEHEFGINEFDGGSYLDKIVQLPFPIPSHEKRMPDLTKRLVQEIGKPHRGEVETLMPHITSHLGDNPRALVRFLNNLLIDVAISKSSPGIGPEIPLSYFAIARILQTRWGGFYKRVVRDRNAAQALANKDEPSSSDSANLKALHTQISSNPDLAALLATATAQDWLKNHELRGQAVNFLFDSQRSTGPSGMFGRNDAVTTVVVAVNQSDAERFKDRVMMLERYFSPRHYTYAMANGGESVRSVIEHHLRPGERVLLAVYGDALDISAMKASADAMLHQNCIVLAIPVPDSSTLTDLDQAASRYLTSLFGPRLPDDEP